MATENGDSAPYAPADNVLTVIRRRRESSLTEVLTPESLRKLGIPQGLEGRTVRALRFIGLVDGDGRQTTEFERLARATSDQYPELLAELIRAAYHSVFGFVGDPSTATDKQLHDAFRGFTPEAQRQRMITLFIALCRESGLIEGGPVHRASSPKRPSAKPPKPADEVQRKPRAASVRGQEPPAAADSSPAGEDADYHLLTVLLKQLPRDGKWTESRKTKWLQAVTANIEVLTTTVGEDRDLS